MPIDDYGVGYSDGTDRKLDDLRHVDRAHLAVAGHCQANHPTMPYVCIDLTAGTGISKGRPGSALIFVEEARRARMRQRTFLIERNPAAVQELRANLQRSGLDAGVTVLHGDNEERIDDVFAAIGSDARFALGLAYWDANGDEPPWELLHRIAVTLPRVDLLLHIGAAYKKWQTALKRREKSLLVSEALAGIGKRHTHLRVPDQNAQWTFALLVNTETDLFRSNFRRQGFRRLGTPEGDALAELLELTDEERRKRHQDALPFEED